MSETQQAAKSDATSGGRGSDVSAAGSEKYAKSAPKARSCIVCRSRKVRCDKNVPSCATCRRANIPCVYPTGDRPPRWARRLERIVNHAKDEATNHPVATPDADPAVNQVMERLRTLEGLVKELTGQLEQARGPGNSSSGAPSAVGSPGSSTSDTNREQQQDPSGLATTADVQKRFGRLVLNDSNRSHYISSGFWSRVIDEIDGLKMDTRSLAMDDSESSGDEMSSAKTPSSQELDRTPSERNAFFFRHNLSPAVSDARDLHPLPSQIPFILNVFSENVNIIVQAVHMPTVTKMVRDMRVGDMTSLTPANECLLFSIYYAAIISMEEEEISTNFGTTKNELSLKYRLGLEYAFAKADFLNVADLVLIQAMVNFLFLVRRHDSTRFVWMMTGLGIRMAQALGLHRDGAHFEHLSPYEVEMRRRVWWALCILDVRASEDQGADLTIATNSFDTRLPLNINDGDIEPTSKAILTAREGVTDMSLALIASEICEVSRQMMALASNHSANSLDQQEHLVNEIYQKFDRGYFRYLDGSGKFMFWVCDCVAKITMSKMRLIIYLPTLFSSRSDHLSDETRDKLFISAIEVAEYNHALNSEPGCRGWRWVFQTYTHWHAIVYMLIEMSRRPWSATVERAWLALQSRWLIPLAQSSTERSHRFWVPLRRLMATARKHRDAEIERLHGDPLAVQRLEMDDRNMPVPESSGPFPAGANALELFRERWRQLVAPPTPAGNAPLVSAPLGAGSSVDPTYASQHDMGSIPAYSASAAHSNGTFQPQSAYLGAEGTEVGSNISMETPSYDPNVKTAAQNPTPVDPPDMPKQDPFSQLPVNWQAGMVSGSNGGLIWADADPSVNVFAGLDVDALDLNMDLDGEVDWYNWVESARNMEWDAVPGGGGHM